MQFIEDRKRSPGSGDQEVRQCKRSQSTERREHCSSGNTKFDCGIYDMRRVGGWLSGSLGDMKAFRLRSMNVRSLDIWENSTTNPSGPGFLSIGRFFFLITASTSLLVKDMLNNLVCT